MNKLSKKYGLGKLDLQGLEPKKYSNSDQGDQDIGDRHHLVMKNYPLCFEVRFGNYRIGWKMTLSFRKRHCTEKIFIDNFPNSGIKGKRIRL